MRIIFCLLALCVGTLSAQQVPNYNLRLVSNLAFDVELSDIWGYVDENGDEYALVGRNEGFSIVSLADPKTPQEVWQVVGFNSQWRDIKTYGDYAYVTCEAPTKLLIVDMRGLPESTNLPYTYWQSPDTMAFSTAHNIYIDKGIAYIFGANHESGGAIMLDLRQDPMNPTPMGIYDVDYLHDGMVRNDTLWGSAVYNGVMHVVDVSDKAKPELLSVWKTPSSFTHNAWVSDDGKHVFTTDEVRNAKIGAYNVEDILNPIETDVWAPSDTGIIPHNTHFINDYLVTSHYTIGLNILDVRRPSNMIEVGRFDSSPEYTYEGFHGCWGAYPWLPSGLILATDIEEGLFVLEPTYQRACYLEGNVTHERTGAPIFYPTIEIIEVGVEAEGSIVGEYKTGYAQSGQYTVRVSKEGYFPKTIENVILRNSDVTYLDVELNDWPTSVNEPLEEAEELSVGPNPAQDVLQLRSSGTLKNVELFDLSGRMVKRFYVANTTSQQLNVSDLSRGTYVLKADGGSFKQMIVLE